MGANVYRTDLDGTITVTTNGVTWAVTTQNQPVAPCIGDANGDGVVDIFDLVIVAFAYNPYGPVSDQRADLNGNNVVNLFDLILVTSNYGCGGQIPAPPATLSATPTDALTATPTQTPTRTSTPTATPTAAPGARIDVTAWVSNPTPRQYSTVTVYGQITRGGVGIAGVPMHTTWHYKTTTSYCDSTSGSNGIASCWRRISRATKGHPVRIEVNFTYEGRSYWASTGFTPQ